VACHACFRPSRRFPSSLRLLPLPRSVRGVTCSTACLSTDGLSLVEIQEVARVVLHSKDGFFLRAGPFHTCAWKVGGFQHHQAPNMDQVVRTSRFDASMPPSPAISIWAPTCNDHSHFDADESSQCVEFLSAIHPSIYLSQPSRPSIPLLRLSRLRPWLPIRLPIAPHCSMVDTHPAHTPSQIARMESEVIQETEMPLSS